MAWGRCLAPFGRIERVWQRQWGLSRDPFSVFGTPYVPLASHEEALARLVYSVEQAQRFITFVAAAGLGKTTVLRRVMDRVRGPNRRCLLVHPPSDARQLPGSLADGLGLPASIGSDRERVWRSLSRAVRAAGLERIHLIFLIDGWEDGLHSAALPDLIALVEAAGPQGAPVTLIRVGRGPLQDPAEPTESWTLAIRLDRLTRSEAETYIRTKLAAADCRERIFTPRALSRLHSWTAGVPRGLDQLATLSLVAGAVQGLEVISPDVVEGVVMDGVLGVNPAMTLR
jgi:general secretion pathway protein A